ncbi:hypothetical protein HRbin30_01162 [bacterium HR30]|nr:hypothetical protein HRbin30_01162 [bacterium HR30]
MCAYDALVAFQPGWRRTWWWRQGRIAMRPYSKTRTVVGAHGSAPAVSISTSAPRRRNRAQRRYRVPRRSEGGGVECESHAFAGIASAMPPRHPSGTAHVPVRTSPQHMCAYDASVAFQPGWQRTWWWRQGRIAMRPYSKTRTVVGAHGSAPAVSISTNVPRRRDRAQRRYRVPREVKVGVWSAKAMLSRASRQRCHSDTLPGPHTSPSAHRPNTCVPTTRRWRSSRVGNARGGGGKGALPCAPTGWRLGARGGRPPSRDRTRPRPQAYLTGNT